VSKRTLRSLALTTLSPLVAGRNAQAWIDAERVVQDLPDLCRRFLAYICVDRVPNDRGQGLTFALAAGVELRALFRGKVDLRSSGWHIQHSIQRGNKKNRELLANVGPTHSLTQNRIAITADNFAKLRESLQEVASTARRR